MNFKRGLISLGVAAGIAMASTSAQAGAIVHLFQWKFNDIANECEKVLGPKGFEGVQITPPAEHLNRPDVWWSVYQPVSLANFNSFGGSEAELRSMITRCKAAGVKIYADAVFNNWANGSGTGTGGSQWSTANYPRFHGNDFHSECSISSYGDRNQVQNCRLVGLPDLNTGSDYVQNEVATYMKTLVGWGVAGFRIDAAKHMSAADLQGILAKAGNPFVYLEVIGSPGEAVQPSEYLGLGKVTEFNYSYNIRDIFNSQIKNLKNVGVGSSFMASDKAQVFVVNHDNERGSAGTVGLNYKTGEKYNLANAFMLAWNYGWPQVLSGYDFSSHDQGAPNTPGCGAGWNCEQRRPTIGNMVMFHNVTQGQAVTNWWDNGNNQIAFSRGNKGFVVINNESGSLTQSLATGLPAGEYCNIVAGDAYCSGSYITVDSSGKANINLAGMKVAAIVAGCTKATPCSTVTPDPTPDPNPNPNPDPTPVPKFSSMNFRGTANAWAATAMTVDATTRVWSTVIDFTGKGDAGGAQRFKFDVYGNWTTNFGDNEADGKADSGNAKDIFFNGVGKYKVTLKESDMSYTVTAVNENQAPKAVVSPATITVTEGDKVVFDASGSTDDNAVTDYSWSSGGTAKTETVTFNSVGTEKVTVTVEDADGLSSTATATVVVKAKEVPQPSFVSTFKKLYYRGTSNSWAAQSMDLVADHTWQTTVTLTGAKTERFKIDASEDMSKVYGDRNDDGVLDANTVTYPGCKGVFTLTVNDETMAYTLEKQGDPYAAKLETLYFSMPATSGKGWTAQPMKLVDDNVWYIRVKLNDVASQRFRFDITGQGTKGQVYGDKDKNGVLDVGGTPIAQSGKGYFIIKLNDKSMKYSVVAQ